MFHLNNKTIVKVELDLHHKNGELLLSGGARLGVESIAISTLEIHDKIGVI